MSGITFYTPLQNKVLHAQKHGQYPQSAMDWRSPWRLREVSRVRASSFSLIKCRRWVRRCERCWYVGVGGRGGGKASGCRHTEGRRAALSTSWELNRPCLLANQGPLWQQSNESRHRALNNFFSIILAVSLFKKKKKRWRNRFKSKLWKRRKTAVNGAFRAWRPRAPGVVQLLCRT